MGCIAALADYPLKASLLGHLVHPGELPRQPQLPGEIRGGLAQWRHPSPSQMDGLATHTMPS
jgi:hypothetical protein